MDPISAKAKVDIQERAAIVPEELIDLMTDGTLEATLFTVQQKFGLTEEQVQILENEIALVLLLFIPVEDFAPNIEESLEVGYETSISIADQVTDEIFSLVYDILESVTIARKELANEKGIASLPNKIERREDLNKLAQTLSNPNRATDQEVQTPIATDSVEPIRTMPEDMNRVHGYGAYRQQQEESGAEEQTSNTDAKESKDDTERG